MTDDENNTDTEKLHAQNLQSIRTGDVEPDVRLRELEDALDELYLTGADRDDELGEMIAGAHDAYQNYIRSMIEQHF